MTHPPHPPIARVSRRTLLGGLAAGAAVLTGCGTGGAADPTAPMSAPRTATGTATGTGSGTSATVTTLLAGRPFYVAHRGGGGDWPEMTAYAYEQESRLPGLQAMEVSVCLSADGVLVCSHDPTTTRVTGVPYTIADQTWSTLSALKVSASSTTDPGQPARPLTRFDEVVEAHAGRFVLFVEAKVPAAVGPLMSRMTGLGHPERVVWKSYVNAPTFAEAKRHGFTTWGYVLDQPSHLGRNLVRFAAAPEIDLLGVQVTEPDAALTQVVKVASRNGKSTLAWPIRTAADRKRTVGLGVQGLMTSTIAELLP